MIEIYTDGACLGNPGQGGYGIILKMGEHEKELSGGYRHTTNNRMELLAVIIALETLKSKVNPATIFSDSKYVIESINNGWVFEWSKHANFKGKKNEDLWMRFLEIYYTFAKDTLTFQWVKGHNGHPENERADELAVAAAESEGLEIDEGYNPPEKEVDDIREETKRTIDELEMTFPKYKNTIRHNDDNTAELYLETYLRVKNDDGVWYNRLIRMGHTIELNDMGRLPTNSIVQSINRFMHDVYFYMICGKIDEEAVFSDGVKAFTKSSIQTDEVKRLTQSQLVHGTN